MGLMKRGHLGGLSTGSVDNAGSWSYWEGGPIRALPQGCVFVFGSNLAGRHGKGAAQVAALHFGAVYGVGEGITGQAYALPTKDAGLRTLPLAAIAGHVGRFLRFAATRPDLKFVVTEVGTGLAGYAPEDIAPMFAAAGPNVLLPRAFIDALTVLSD